MIISSLCEIVKLYMTIFLDQEEVNLLFKSLNSAQPQSVSPYFLPEELVWIFTTLAQQEKINAGFSHCSEVKWLT